MLQIGKVGKRRACAAVVMAGALALGASLVAPGSLAAAGAAVAVQPATGSVGAPATVVTAGGAAGNVLRFNAAGQVLDVRNYGARGDGVADDRAEIQAAIDAAAGQNPAGVVVVPPGTYNLGNVLSLRANVELVGYGPQRSTLRATGNSTGGVYLWSNTRVRGLTLQGGNPNGSTVNCSASVNGIDSSSGTGNLIEANAVQGWGCMGMQIGRGSTRNIISGNTIRTNGNEGVLLPGTSNANFVERNDIYNNQINGIDINGSGNYVRANSLHDNGLRCRSGFSGSDCTGVTIWQSGAGQVANSNVIEGNTISNNAEVGVFISVVNGAAADSNVLSNNVIQNNGYIGVQVRNTNQSGSAKNNQVLGNTIQGNRQWGIFIDSATDGKYANNEVTNSAPYDGIITYQSFANAPARNSITGNDVNANAGYGINLNQGVSNSVTGNFVYNNTKGTIRDAATSSTVSGNTTAAPSSPRPDGPVSTSCPSYPTDKGSATVNVNVPTSATYQIWSRLLVGSDLSDSYYLQVDTDCPILVGNQGGLASNAWAWINTRDSSTSTTLRRTFSAGTHTLKLIGREAGVQIDRLLLTADLACVPSGTGDNCLGIAPAPGPAPAPGGSCPDGQFRAEYFNNQTLSGNPTFVQCESAINYDWGLGGPGHGVPATDFSVRWIGLFDFTAGDHTFAARADDGVRLWVDTVDLLIDRWTDSSAVTRSAARTLTAGQHEVKVTYYQHLGVAVAQVSWQ